MGSNKTRLELRVEKIRSDDIMRLSETSIFGSRFWGVLYGFWGERLSTSNSTEIAEAEAEGEAEGEAEPAEPEAPALHGSRGHLGPGVENLVGAIPSLRWYIMIDHYQFYGIYPFHGLFQSKRKSLWIHGHCLTRSPWPTPETSSYPGRISVGRDP